MKIAVIGLGKIGASICADLKALSAASRVTGVDTNPDSVAYCVSEGIVDKGFESPREVPPDTDISVLAVPVERMESVARDLFTALAHGAVVTDVGSVKAPVAEAVGRILPEGVSFVPAHPVAGDETHGARNFKTGIFRGNPVVITGGPDGAAEKVGEMWKKLGATVVRMSSRDHDRLFAFASHLPHVCSYSLAAAAAAENAFAVSGGGLRDATRTAMSDPELWAGILVMNSGPVLEAVESFSRMVDETAAAIREGDRKKLAEILERGRAAKARAL